MVVIGGDFNARGIDWENLSAPPGTPDRSICLRLLEILSNYLLSQMNLETTRETSIVDLFITNKPGLVKSCTVIPGLSDHEIVLTDYDIRAVSVRKPPRTIFKWGKADWTKIKEDLVAFRDSFMAAHAERSVEQNYKDLSVNITQIMDKHIPSKLLKPKQSAPWFNHKLKRMCKKKQRLYCAARKSGKRDAWERYRAHKRDTLKAFRSARWSYLNDVLSQSLAEGISKPFWQFILTQKQDNLGISAFKKMENSYLTP